MARVLGVGGVFFKSPDPQRLCQWYAQWLGLNIGAQLGVAFKPQDMPRSGGTVWSVFSATTDYFAPSEQPFMFNFVVDQLEEALQQVQAGGAQLIGTIEEHNNGRFGWFMDPDGNKVELWEPIPVRPYSRRTLID